MIGRVMPEMRELISARDDGYRFAPPILRHPYGRTAGVSTGSPRARHIR